MQKNQTVIRKVWMAEWSKALHLSCSLFGGVGSNPTPDNFQVSYSKNIKHNIFFWNQIFLKLETANLT